MECFKELVEWFGIFLGYKSNTPQDSIKKQQGQMMAAVYELDEY